MLVLVAGATGNIGKNLIEKLVARDHQVRCLSRNPSKLDPSLHEQLESFVQSDNYYDIPALDRACHGVDAIVCAYAALPELQLDGQLLLLRAAERAGVTKFVAASWNYDWRHMKLGEHEVYDPYISFRSHAEMSSPIKPVYILTGVFAEVLFCVPGNAPYSTAHNGVWCPENKRMEVWGSGDEIWHWTTEADAAEYTVAVLEHKDAAKGGLWSVCSGANSLRELSSIYGTVRDRHVDVVVKGSAEELRATADEARQRCGAKKFWEYIGYFVQLYTIEETWVLKDIDNSKLDVQPTTFGEFLQQYPEV